jgi:hypothetical protein
MDNKNPEERVPEEQLPENRTQEIDEEDEAQRAQRRRLAESWREVGEQLQEFGAKFASAFRSGWAQESQASEEEAVRNLRDDLRSVADRLDRVMKRAASETEPQRAAAARATRGASERLLAETRDAAIVALQALTRQLEGLTGRLERAQREREEQAASEPTPLPSGEARTEEDRSGSGQTP